MAGKVFFSFFERATSIVLLFCALIILAGLGTWAEGKSEKISDGNTITSPLGNRLQVAGKFLTYKGTALRLIGQGCWTAVTRGDFDFQAEADWYQPFRANITRIKLINTFIDGNHDPQYPWEKDGTGKFDLNTWNEGFWTRLTDFLACNEAQERIVLLQFFDEVGIENAPNRWARHPFHPDNNVNNLGLPANTGVPAFYNMGNQELIQIQDAYVNRLLDETASFGNIIYEICNEYTGPTDWASHWIDLFCQYEVEHEISLLLTNMSCTADNLQLEMTHPGIDLLDVWHNPESIRDYLLPELYYRFASFPSPKPIIAGRIGQEPDITDSSLEDRVYARKSLWIIFLAGGMGTCTKEDSVNHQPRWGDPVYDDDMVWERTLLGLHTFIDNLGALNSYTPDNSHILQAPCFNCIAMSSPTIQRQIVYLEGGGEGNLVLGNFEQGRYFFSTFSPSECGFAFQERTEHGGGNLTLNIPPFEEDIVVLLEKKELDVKVSHEQVGATTYNINLHIRSFGHVVYDYWSGPVFPGMVFFQGVRLFHPEYYLQRTVLNTVEQVWEAFNVYLIPDVYELGVFVNLPLIDQTAFTLHRFHVE